MKLKTLRLLTSLSLTLNLSLNATNNAANSFDEKETQAQKIDSAFYASDKCYKLFDFLKKSKHSSIHEITVADSYLKGFFRFKDPKTLYQENPELKKKLLMDGYDIEGFSCVNSKLHSFIPIQDCKMFIVVYKPLLPELPPIISVKGTSTFGDFVENIKRKGSGYLAQILEPIKIVVPGFREVSDALETRVENFTNRTLNEFQREAVLNKKYVQALNSFSAQYPGRRLLFTGHSLGGSLVSNFANAYTKSEAETEHVQVDLVTFNSLAPSVTLGYFYEKAEKPSGDLVTVNPDITGLHIYAYDDPLQIYNKIKNGTHYGKSIKLSSQRNMDPYGRLAFSAIEGHHMKSIALDINFSRKPLESSEFLLKAQKALQSGEAYKRIRHYWNTEEQEYQAAYTQNIRADRGKKYIAQLTQALLDPETILALGTPIAIGEIRDPVTLKSKIIYDTERRPPLSL
ncbi:MAG: hypothetical protein WCK43_06210 [bacterium]